MKDYQTPDYSSLDYSQSASTLPRVVVARKNISFTALGISTANTEGIFKIGNPLKPYNPKNVINSINGFVVDGAYYIIEKEPIDLSDAVIPPIN